MRIFCGLKQGLPRVQSSLSSRRPSPTRLKHDSACKSQFTHNKSCPRVAPTVHWARQGLLLMVLEIETSDETTLNGRQVAMPAAGRPSSRYLRLRMAFVSAQCQLRFLHRELGDGRGVLGLPTRAETTFFTRDPALALATLASGQMPPSFLSTTIRRVNLNPTLWLWLTAWTMAVHRAPDQAPDVVYNISYLTLPNGNLALHI
ncbi:hypothetical protein JMJ77_0005027 [Colletotrichum scovillei]|uniref:Uncharacterized protein n=1 Tax=Colletotrichum scovillei TaxID=1209932 RepID=A0A9P7RHI4_9PEZI|nr:hypothetical protein JMJ77_0005027 [Colletotrichum scovillei]KAG7076240.1 hypothetical protein JMJ76_0013506 [Colletotrichum scovillei]KAG7083352.1 hypothetical protein JMJ78_0008798 [Colletotrichum scovillei]